MDGAGNASMSQEAKVSKFLHELAWHVEFEPCPAGINPQLSLFLPDILQDSHLRREFFLKPKHTIDAIIKHVFVDPEERDLEGERREFELGDLPFDGTVFADSAREARQAIGHIIGEGQWKDQSLELLNYNLDKAISRTLDFSADNLIDLMKDVPLLKTIMD